MADKRRCRHCAITVGGNFLGSSVKIKLANIERDVQVPSIHIKNTTLGYDRYPAIHQIDIQIDRGSLLAIIGPNGSGKSTLFKGIVGELRPLEGQICVNDPIAYLPQQREIDRSFPICVSDFVAMGLWQWIGAWRAVSLNLEHRVHEALARVGLADFEHRPINSLSGGQMQRMLFARLLLQDAPLILLDEPFTAIDQKTAADLLALLMEWHSEGRTIVAALHDLDQVRQYFPETLLLARKLIDQGKTAEVLTTENLVRARQVCGAFEEKAARNLRRARRVT